MIFSLPTLIFTKKYWSFLQKISMSLIHLQVKKCQPIHKKSHLPWPRSNCKDRTGTWSWSPLQVTLNSARFLCSHWLSARRYACLLHHRYFQKEKLVQKEKTLSRSGVKMTAVMHSSHAHFLMIISLACGHTVFQRTIYEASSLCKCFKTSPISQSCPSVLLPGKLSLNHWVSKWLIWKLLLWGE